jgi:hypothetical protein
MRRFTYFIAANLLATAPALAQTGADDGRIAALEKQVAALSAANNWAHDRGQIENLFGRYMYLHSAFRDPEIIPLWVKKGTPGVRAQYSNNGVYTDWDKIMSYHAQRQADHAFHLNPGDRSSRRRAERARAVDHVGH